ncbi:UNVERIFIED_CONTAM: hypothetical protein Sangu_1281300 [Sesamum angustifolium]|uniref:Uncharacterized protein n=1 Tax=Sesamum angustifolium TaxID=2727405 RepID=A0AAW2NJT0_9LAMI
MAGSDSQKQLLTLIRDFTAEKSQGERRIAKLKKRIEELRSEVDASNRELEEAKRGKEMAEQELNGRQVELSMCEASNQALEARIALTNNEDKSKVGLRIGRLLKRTLNSFICSLIAHYGAKLKLFIVFLTLLLFEYAGNDFKSEERFLACKHRSIGYIVHCPAGAYKFGKESIALGVSDEGKQGASGVEKISSNFALVCNLDCLIWI